MEWFAHRGDFSVPQFAYLPKCVENGYSRKFAVASAPPSSAASAQERHGDTVLGSKRTYQVAFVAPLCIKGLRLVTLQLPEKSWLIGPAAVATWHTLT